MIVSLLGWVGLALLLAAYFLDATDILPDGSKLYFLINLIGSVSIAVHAYMIGSLPILILNAVWAFISLYELIKQ